jgi:endo-1,4-beta-xylanase
MKNSRREFLRTAGVGAAAMGLVPSLRGFAPLFGGQPRTAVFRPYLPLMMPPMNFVYAADASDEPFRADVRITPDGIEIPESLETQRFSLNTRWYVRDFGYVFMAADNDGQLYARDDLGMRGSLHLNYEFARSRVGRNNRVRTRYEREGTRFSPEVLHLVAMSEELLDDARKTLGDGERAARLADRALSNALWAGEKIELEKARSDIQRKTRKDRVWFGCETRQYVWARSEEFTKEFLALFNFATITHYVWDSWYELFEPREGEYNWGIKDNIVNWLAPHGVEIEGRPIFWPHPTVTPEWLTNKSFDGVVAYLHKHTSDLVRHYGDRINQWEVVNEMHDWANVHHFSESQITDLVRIACQGTRDANPRAVRIINNCAPFAEYVARGRQAREDARRPLRSPRRFIKDLIDAGVEFDVIGLQIYFPQRDLSDIARLLERFEPFGKPIYITEIGASSNFSAPNPSGAVAGSTDEPYAWHRRWDEELQADWLEQVYTLFYSKPYVRAINWYDFSDFRPFIVNGGLVREDSSPKQSFHRLHDLLASWNNLPSKQ